MEKLFIFLKWNRRKLDKNKKKEIFKKYTFQSQKRTKNQKINSRISEVLSYGYS